MGIKCFGNSFGNYTAPNPNPNNYQVEKVIFFDDSYVLAKIKYNGCTTYSGNKIAVYKQHPSYIIARYKDSNLDPHFLENEISPIARFPASLEGESHALAFLRLLCGKVQKDAPKIIYIDSDGYIREVYNINDELLSKICLGAVK